MRFGIYRAEQNRAKARKQVLLKDLESSVARIEKRKERLLEHIEELRKEQLQDTQAELDTHHEALAEKSREIQRVKELIADLDRMMTQYSDSMRAAEERKLSVEDEMKRNESTRTQLETSIRQIEQQQRDRGSAFGPRTNDILQLIEKNKAQFKRVPIGPLGTLPVVHLPCPSVCRLCEVVLYFPHSP